jgi:serine/threonine protein kinase
MSNFTIGKFQVVEPLGTGAHSSILHIRRAADSTHYALKVVSINGSEDQKYLDQAEHEFKVAKMLDHPSVIKVYALERHKNWLWRVTRVHLLIEYVHGQTLDTLPRIPLPQLVQIFERIASALVHMHRRGVCHADLKPKNIMLDRSGQVKIIDLGLAWTRGESKTRIQGTPEYMAPEQARRKFVNERTDLFNFGATMYRMVTWRLPPSTLATDEGGLPIDAQTWHRLLKPVTDFAPNIPQPLADLIHHCLSFNARQRPEGAADVQQTLARLVEQLVQGPEDRLDMLEF